MNDGLPAIYALHSMLTALSAVFVVTLLYRRQFQHFSGFQMAMTALLVTCGAGAMGLLAGFHYAMELYFWQGWEISPTRRMDNLNEHFVTTMLVLNWLFVAFAGWFFIYLQVQAKRKISHLIKR